MLAAMGHRITIVGPGAVGATLAGAFAASGADVSLLGRPGPHCDAIATRGLVLYDGVTRSGRRHRFPTADTAERLPVPDLAVLCVKSRHTLTAARSVRPWIEHGVDVLVVARRTGVPSPSLDVVYALLALREYVRGHRATPGT
jgi:2-dehydropantoate 2-reductase